MRDMQGTNEKPVAWLGVEVRTPPFSAAARIAAGELLGKLQSGAIPPMPHARPLPSVGRRCLELRVRDGNLFWRILCRLDADAVVVGGVFPKKSEKLPKAERDAFLKRLAEYDNA